jgi:hypothetical protein
MNLPQCRCCHKFKPCECFPELCWDCGRCPEHCECETFIICECEQIDVDLVDARYCLAHGPDSALARRQLEQEAADEAAWWRGMEAF